MAKALWGQEQKVQGLCSGMGTEAGDMGSMGAKMPEAM